MEEKIKVYNLVSTKSGKPVPNQFVIDKGNEKTFQSYETTIAVYNNRKNKLLLSEDYKISRTTSKYFWKFFLENVYGNQPEKAKFDKLDSQYPLLFLDDPEKSRKLFKGLAPIEVFETMKKDGRIVMTNF